MDLFDIFGPERTEDTYGVQTWQYNRANARVCAPGGGPWKTAEEAIQAASEFTGVAPGDFLTVDQDLDIFARHAYRERRDAIVVYRLKAEEAIAAARLPDAWEPPAR